MADWLLLARADADASGAAYVLYGYGVPGAPPPFAAWLMVRTVHSASALPGGVSRSLSIASWASAPGLDSAAAWAGRASLVYSEQTLPDGYSGTPDLLAALQPPSSPGGAMNALIGTPTYLIIRQDEGWTDISAAMEIGAAYQIVPQENDVAAILAADGPPALDQGETLAIHIGRGEAREPCDSTWKFTGQPIWALTDDAQARLKIIQRG